MAASLRTQKTAIAVDRHFACERQRKGLIGITSDAIEVEERKRNDCHAACGCAANGRMHPARHAGEPPEPGTKAQQRIGEGDRDNGREQAQQRIPHQRRGVGERVVALHVKDRVGAQDRMFDNSRQRGGDNDAGEHGLVEVADQFLKSEGNSGDGRVKGSGDASRHTH